MGRMVHPIIMYPYNHPRETMHLESLYNNLIKQLNDDTENYSKPITVLSADSSRRIRQGPRSNDFISFLDKFVSPVSQIIEVWSVDTCQRWLAGFGEATKQYADPEHVYWLIPGDFQYASDSGVVLCKLKQIPDAVNYSSGCRMCVGEISVPVSSPKQLIDTYGTYGLLYNWFPNEAKIISQITSKPRTEFFAINHESLMQALQNTWYAYEQTIVLMLQIIGNPFINNSGCIRQVDLGTIEDPPEGRETLALALKQIERMDRMLKDLWRDVQRRNGSHTWPEEFKQLDSQSEDVRHAALVILRRTLVLP